MPEQYEGWLDAQIYSNQAAESCANLKDLINPLEVTKDPSVLDNMWKFINLVCFRDLPKPPYSDPPSELQNNLGFVY
jgi:hypothetical protein